MTATRDGRRARGEARRRQLVEATLAILERDGAAGVTHRAVAEQAGVALASASYHFAGIDDLILAALLHATDEIAATLQADDARDLAALARLIHGGVSGRRRLLIAEYGYLLAARRPELRRPATAWLELLADHFAPDLGGVERSAFKATVEGILLHTLLSDEPATVSQIEATLRAAWPGGHER